MERISARQLVMIGIVIVLQITTLSLPSQNVLFARQQAWLCFLIAGILVLASIWLVAKTMERFPDTDLFQALTMRFPVAGRAIGMIYMLFFFTTFARDIRLMTDFFNAALLQATPLWVISIFIAVTIVMIARGGVENLARMTELFAPLYIIASVAINLLLLKEYDITFLMPFFEYDWPGIFAGVWYDFSYLGEIIALPLIFSNRTFRFRYGFYAMLIGCGMVVMYVFSVLLTLGPDMVPRLLYPGYELVRQVRITDFLDRFELPLVSFWLPVTVTKTAYCLYVVCHGMQRMFSSMNAKLLSLPIGFLGFVCSFWFFSNTVQILLFNRVWTLIALLPQLLLPLLLFVLLRPRRKEVAAQTP